MGRRRQRGAELIDSGELAPVSGRAPWIASGLALQVVGVSIPAATAIARARREGLAGSISHYTVTLISREMFRSRADVALIVLGIVLFTAGAVALARPFVRRRATLVIAVPIAAVAGLAVLGVVAVIVAALVALLGDSAGGGGGGDGGSIGDLLSGIDPWPGGRSRDDDDDRRRR